MLLGCTVDVDGTRYNDGTGRPADDPAGVILAGLSVIWGRSTILDQPAPSTCKLTVADWTGTPDGLSAFPVGAPVDVDAAGIDYGAPSTSTFTDPTLTRLGPVTDSPGVTLTIHPDGTGVRADPSTAGAGRPPAAHRTVFRPDDRTDTDPSAWIDVPRMVPGTHWQARVAGTSPYAGFVYPVLVAFRDPSAAPFTLALYPARELSGAFDYLLDFIPPGHHGGWWAGVALETYRFATWSDLAARTGLVTWAEQPQTWEAMGVTDVTAVDVTAPAPSSVIAVRVFSGRVTDVTAAYDLELGALVAEITAADFTADLANRRVAAAPWPTETATDRIARILASAGAGGVTAQIDPVPGAYLIARDDVDAQSPTALLEAVAISVDAVMWAATSDPTGPYLRFEDAASRPTGRVLTEAPPGHVTIVLDGAAHGALTLDACALLIDPSWRQDTTDVLTRVGTRWLELGTDTDGKPTETERTEWVTDPGAEAVHGVRSLSVGTQLTTGLEAATLGTTIAGRVFGSGWRIDGLTVDESALADLGTVDGVTATVTLARLLDGTSRNGLLTSLTSLPSWAPNAIDGAALVYLEGGVYRYDGAAWTLELLTSDPRGQGDSALWSELPPAWLWSMFDPALTWAHLQGATAP